uniref:Fish-egg lectin n=1 Tax=Chelonoidis abingdonii TaxID=106734 RepID=A0A8C0J7S6_CHEAB
VYSYSDTLTEVRRVNSADNIYTLHGDSWVQVLGSLKHVMVGPAGIWGVNNNNIYKLVGGSWQQVTGLLKQIDAGGDMFIAGVNIKDDVYCLSRPATVSAKGASDLPWVNIVGKLKYYSCGVGGCWGVNSADDIYFRFDVSPDPCAGSRWEQVPGKLSMIEVGTEGEIDLKSPLYRYKGRCSVGGLSWSSVPKRILLLCRLSRF